MEKMVKFIAPDIPHAVILRILNKLPVKSLVKFSCVSKFWLNVITNDQGFNKSHFLESQKSPVLILTSKNSEQDDMNNLYYLEKVHGNSLKKITTLKKIRHIEGYCNGLVFSWDRELVDFHHWSCFVFEICNLSRFEKISVLSAFQCKGRHEFTTPRICGFQCEGKHTIVTPRICGFRFGYDYICNEYKVLCIISYTYFNFEDDNYENHYEYFIYTLGSTKPAWREIKHPWLEQCPASYYQWCNSDFNPPIFCRGTLFWKMGKEKQEEDEDEQEEENDEEDEEVNYGDLISFNFHDEQFKVIKLPDDDEFVEDYNKGNFYQLEYKGCFCFASMKKFDSWSGDIELHILKDKIWMKETISFDIPTEEYDPAPLCNYRYMTFTKGNNSTRIICSSDQIFLYWRRDSCTIHLYNVHSEELTEVKYPGEGDTHYLDYYIYNHVENSLSLKAMAKRSIKEAADRYSERPTSTPALFFCPAEQFLRST